MRFSKDWIAQPRARPLAIAHRGASAYAFDNTLKAFRTADLLGADLWEVDVHLTRDRVVVACHDADLLRVCGDDRAIAEMSYDDIAGLSKAAGQAIPRFSEVIALAWDLGAGLYVDAKVESAARVAIDLLIAAGFERAIIGTSDKGFCRSLKAVGCPYAVSLLVGLGGDPFHLADEAKPDLIHPCWERAGERPDRLLDAAFFQAARDRRLPVVTWHEERREVAAALCTLPVFGICSDTPELLKPYKQMHPQGPEIVCHRGLRSVAPENTLASVRAAYSAGFHYAEVDVHETDEGVFFVLHDQTLDRTTDHCGPVQAVRAADYRSIDAGIRVDPFFAGETLPRLVDVLVEARRWGGKLYVELKTGDPLHMVETVASILPESDVFFWSFDTVAMRRLRDAYPTARMMARAQDYDCLEDCLADLGPAIVEFDLTAMSREAFARVRETGARAMVAYMGKDPEVMAGILALQPDLLNVDEPFLAWRLMASGAGGDTLE